MSVANNCNASTTCTGTINATCAWNASYNLAFERKTHTISTTYAIRPCCSSVVASLLFTRPLLLLLLFTHSPGFLAQTIFAVHLSNATQQKKKTFRRFSVCCCLLATTCLFAFVLIHQYGAECV